MTPEEQLIQEARLAAEKVYPTESYVNDARREGNLQGCLSFFNTYQFKV